MKWFPLISLALIACGAQAREQFHISMQTQTDDGQNLGGVEVFHKDTQLGVSTTSGRIDVVVDAVGGSTFEVQFQCPKGFHSTRESVLVPLRNSSQIAAEESGEASYALTLECRPTKRQGVVVVNSNMENVPVKIGSTIVGHTDKKGVAHIPVTMAPKEVFEITLDTSSNPFLRPQNPQFPFMMPNHDEVFVLEEPFRLEIPPPPPPVKKTKRRKKKKKPVVVLEEPIKNRPVRINSGKDQWGTIGATK